MTMEQIKFLKDVIVDGNFTVAGTSTIENTEQILTKGALTVINSDNNQLETTLMGTVIRTGKQNTDGKYIDYGIIYDPISEAVRLGIGTYDDESNTFSFSKGDGNPITTRSLTAENNGQLIVWNHALKSIVSAGMTPKELQDGNTKTSLRTPENSVVVLTDSYDAASDTITYSVDVNMNNYYTSEDVDGIIDSKVNIIVNGTGTSSNGGGAVAEGAETTASGWASHAEGWETTASGNQAHSEGRNTTAEGVSAHAEGYNAVASGDDAHAEGRTTKASGISSHAEGHNAEASGEASHAEGFQTIANGTRSHAEGSESTTTGYAAHAEGNVSKAFGDFSHAEGASTTVYAEGRAAHAEGNWSEATGEASHAEGNYCKAVGNSSHAEGHHCETHKYASHAEGNSCIVYGESAHVEGYHTMSEHDHQHVCGKYNKPGYYAVIVGNGTADTRNNAYTLDWSGNAIYEGSVKCAALSLGNTSLTESQLNKLLSLIG